MKRRDFITSSLAIVAAGSHTFAEVTKQADTATAGELLYNGIRLPVGRPGSIPCCIVAPPYPAAEPPEVVPIDVGRQLFVDDFLIEQTTLERTFHRPEYHPGGPVIRPDQPWERQGDFPMAAVYSDGVWYDPQDRLFKMWYMGGLPRLHVLRDLARRHRVGEAEARRAGRHEHRLDAAIATRRSSGSITKRRPARRWKLFRAHREEIDGPRATGSFTSTSRRTASIGATSSRRGSIYPRSTVFRNPFRKSWEFGIRKDSITQVGRCRRYSNATTRCATRPGTRRIAPGGSAPTRSTCRAKTRSSRRSSRTSTASRTRA